MKFNVGDKVTIREDLSVSEWNVVDDMEQYRGKVATIVALGSNGDYLIDLDDRYWYWNDFMFEEGVEKTVDDTEKFRAFLNEVARGDKTSGSYYFTYSKLYDVVSAEDLDKSEIDDLVDEIVNFYSNFEPKTTPKPKKMTLEEIEERLGYKVELVED